MATMASVVLALALALALAPVPATPAIHPWYLEKASDVMNMASSAFDRVKHTCSDNKACANAVGAVTAHVTAAFDAFEEAKCVKKAGCVPIDYDKEARIALETDAYLATKDMVSVFQRMIQAAKARPLNGLVRDIHEVDEIKERVYQNMLRLLWKKLDKARDAINAAEDTCICTKPVRIAREMFDRVTEYMHPK